ncbi:hypothetical protein KC906_04725, partial [Candidatus Kaiserbacteria bacterium]|nr:hypothetical protein [Candidatus Kaiserbacteria bacterium]
REISAITKIPLHEAFAHLHSEKPLAFIKSLTPKQAEEVETLLDSYTEKISELFQQTGDALSIPKQIILHSDLDSEPLFASLVSKAAKRAIKAEPFITPVTKELITQTFKAATTDSGTKIPLDTALLLSAQFFHKLQKPFAFEDF